jgi:uncharacterized protein YjbI with pentapeptide repeats
MVEIKQKLTEETLRVVEGTLAGANLAGASLEVAYLLGVDQTGAKLDAANLAYGE